MAKQGLTRQEVKPLLGGVINIQFTPFKSATEIDEEALRGHTRFMIEGGMVTGRGVQVIGGSNGEGFSLSDDEYRQLIDIVVEEAAGRVPIVVGCVRPATEPVIELARYAEEAGADAVMILSPHYYSNPPDELVYKHFKAIADATDIGIMIYDNPGVTGKDLSVENLTRLAEIENIVAVKETTSNMFKLREVAYRLGDRFTLNANTYRWMMPLDYQIGVVGHNNIFANWDPAFALRVHDIDRKGDFEEADKLWTEMVDFYNFVFTKGMYKATAYGKEMTRIAGHSMGDYERLPLERPTEEERVTLRELMKNAGMACGPRD